MENLRWILILAGVAILAVLYFSGKPKRARDASGVRSGRRGSGKHDFLDPLMGDDSFKDDPIEGFDMIDSDDFSRPAQGGQVDAARTSAESRAPAELDEYRLPEEPVFDENLGRSRDSSPGFTSFAQKIESISERLTPKRRQRIEAFEPADMEDMAVPESQPLTKIVTLHVVAPQNTVFDGGQLLDVFDKRGYHFGDMNIFHSMHKGDTVFSIAKMVEPGYFDVEDIQSFVTPGVTLILQLPAPVPADVAFEVLISEAYEMASELNAAVLDGDRNNLSKQTLQHMRESIYEYMHRQKYFSKVPS